jgi:hypothetical protein
VSDVPASLQSLVRLRAGERCEYCGLSQVGQEATFHLDHVVPRVAGGPTISENLALACVGCSLRKGAKTEATDPDTGQPAALFNPRRDRWSEHFRWNGVLVVGLTPVGRATVAALGLNRPPLLKIRREEEERGRHPPGQAITNGPSNGQRSAGEE